jgi:putative acetyltransferase
MIVNVWGVEAISYNSPMPTWSINQDDPHSQDVVSLLQRHLDFARSITPPEDVHALDLEGLSGPDITFVSLRDGGRLLGIGAIKQLDPIHVELKSIHTAEEARGKGVGRAIVEHLIGLARERGAGRVSLETGSMDEFAPSRSLYSRVGFVECGPFAEYVPSRNSTYMTMELH